MKRGNFSLFKKTPSSSLIKNMKNIVHSSKKEQKTFKDNLKKLAIILKPETTESKKNISFKDNTLYDITQEYINVNSSSAIPGEISKVYDKLNNYINTETDINNIEEKKNEIIDELVLILGKIHFDTFANNADFLLFKLEEKKAFQIKGTIYYTDHFINSQKVNHELFTKLDSCITTLKKQIAEIFTIDKSENDYFESAKQSCIQLKGILAVIVESTKQQRDSISEVYTEEYRTHLDKFKYQILAMCNEYVKPNINLLKKAIDEDKFQEKVTFGTLIISNIKAFHNKFIDPFERTYFFVTNLKNDKEYYEKRESVLTLLSEVSMAIAEYDKNDNHLTLEEISELFKLLKNHYRKFLDNYQDYINYLESTVRNASENPVECWQKPLPQPLQNVKSLISASTDLLNKLRNKKDSNENVTDSIYSKDLFSAEEKIHKNLYKPFLDFMAITLPKVMICPSPTLGNNTSKIPNHLKQVSVTEGTAKVSEENDNEIIIENNNYAHLIQIPGSDDEKNINKKNNKGSSTNKIYKIK